MRNQISLKRVIKELYEQEVPVTAPVGEATATDPEAVGEPKVEFPEWLANKIKTTHGEPGQGSIFASPDSVQQIVLDLIEKNKSEIAKIATTTGVLASTVPGIGYDLVMPIEEAEALPDAEVTETEKVEGQNKLKVPAVKTSAPKTDPKFATDQLTVIIRPKKDQAGAVIPNEFITLSAFPGKDLPRTSEWAGKYAIIIPDQQPGQTQTPNAEGAPIQEAVFSSSRFKKLAGILRD